MLFVFLKKINNNKINVHNVTVKLKKDKLNKIYIGKIVNIDVEEGKDHENFQHMKMVIFLIRLV